MPLLLIDQVVKLKLWWVQGTTPGDFKAFFWITQAGKLPKPKPDSKINNGIIKLLVKYVVTSN